MPVIATRRHSEPLRPNLVAVATWQREGAEKRDESAGVEAGESDLRQGSRSLPQTNEPTIFMEGGQEKIVGSMAYEAMPAAAGGARLFHAMVLLFLNYVGFLLVWIELEVSILCAMSQSVLRSNS
ncbi:hypothetical protein [Methylocella tundrae]|uniref:Uncharacterized protein n=1 Tax=Methylocella tundrae TaxID=227605 RepID=A0A4U8YV42_METTU|nr:hypothetical protein [Methylocella tundrae]WPP05325.1 hypothetical protein SIN04_05725 [Methylocella tundrae]VFU07689.1 protein of unknown function [Methylocella tundrae]